MNKQEAIEALRNNKTITHTSFTSEEWMKQASPGMLEFEDGVIVTTFEFWKWRPGKTWEDGWSVTEAKEEKAR